MPPAMLSPAPPDAEAARRLLASLEGAAPVHGRIGSTRDGGGPPDGFREERWRAVVGRGGAAFARARAGLERWEMYRQAWLRLLPPPPAPQPGVAALVAARHLGAARPGVWSRNPVRVVWRDDAPGALSFAVAALPGHAEAGEERFSVVLEPGGAVVFELLVHSRPGRALVRLASPYARSQQRRFARGAIERMKLAAWGAPARDASAQDGG